MSELVAKEEQLKKENGIFKNNNLTVKQIVDNSNNKNIKNNKNYGNSKNGLTHNNLDIGPFIPAGSNFEYKLFD